MLKLALVHGVARSDAFELVICCLFPLWAAPPDCASTAQSMMSDPCELLPSEDARNMPLRAHLYSQGGMCFAIVANGLQCTVTLLLWHSGMHCHCGYLCSMWASRNQVAHAAVFKACRQSCTVLKILEIISMHHHQVFHACTPSVQPAVNTRTSVCRRTRYLRAHRGDF